MRKCERCNLELITDGIGLRSIEGWDINKIQVYGVNTREKGPNAIIYKGRIGDSIERILDKANTITVCVSASIAICPNCGKIEHYLDSEELEKFKEFYSLRLKE